MNYPKRFFNKFSLLKVFVLFTLLAVSGKLNILQAQCDECPEPKVIFYDTDMRIPVPPGGTEDNLQKQRNWIQLTYENKWFRGEIINTDNKFDCVNQRIANLIPTENSDGLLASHRAIVPAAGTTIPWDSEYLIHGWIDGDDDNCRLTIQMETAYSRKIVHSASRSFPGLLSYNNNSNFGVNIAREEFIPLIDIIREFEKEERDNNTDINIYIDELSVSPEKSKVKKGEEVEIEFKLIDCDGTPLKGREVLLQGGSFAGSSLARCTNGRFTNSTTVTDANGIAKATFKAGIAEGKAVIRVYHKYFKPSGDEYCAYGEAEITIKKERPEKFFGKMEATVTTHKASPNFRNPVEESETEETYFCYMGMTSSPESIKKLGKHEFRANVLGLGLQYPVFWGMTVRRDDGEPNKVKSTIKEKTYSEQFGEFQLDYEATTSGESNGYEWNFSVNPYARRGTGIQSIDGHAQYCVKLYMSGNIRLHQDPKYKTTGHVTGRRRISEDEFEQISESVDEDSYLGLAQCDCEKQEQSEDKYVLPLIIETPQGFEDYLLNPEGTYLLNLSGRWYAKGDGTEEFEKTIKVKITIAPDE